MNAVVSKDVAIENRAIHAGLAGGVALFLIFFITSIVVALAKFGGDKISALSRASEQVAAYSLRLNEQRAGTHAALDRIGATPADLAALSTAETAKALVSGACEKLASEFGGACESSESPMNDRLSFHQARFITTGDPTVITDRLAQSIAAPLHIRSLSLRHVGPSNEVELAALIEMIGAQSISEVP